MTAETKSLVFGLEARERRGKSVRQLTISGPTEVMKHALTAQFGDNLSGRISKRQVYSLELDAETEKTIFRLNARALGRLGWGPQLEAVRKINYFVAVLARMTMRGEVEHDPRLRFLAFYPSPMEDELVLGLAMQRPEAESPALQALVREQVMGQALQLNHYRDMPTDWYERSVKVGVNLDSDYGVNIGLSVHSSIHTMGEDWRPSMQNFELWSNNVANSTEPLIYLAGATALANADELLAAA